MEDKIHILRSFHPASSTNAECQRPDARDGHHPSHSTHIPDKTGNSEMSNDRWVCNDSYLQRCPALGDPAQLLLRRYDPRQVQHRFHESMFPYQWYTFRSDFGRNRLFGAVLGMRVRV